MSAVHCDLAVDRTAVCEGSNIYSNTANLVEVNAASMHSSARHVSRDALLGCHACLCESLGTALEKSMERLCAHIVRMCVHTVHTYIPVQVIYPRWFKSKTVHIFQTMTAPLYWLLMR